MDDFEPGLHKGEVFTNDDIRQLFKCSPVGSMRRSHGTDSLVLISGESAGPYHDRWEGAEFHFTARGLRGDQKLEEVQNRTLADSNTNGVAVFHFDNPEGDRFVFTGRMKLAGAPYTERQRDEIDDDRQVWVFPLAVAPSAVESRSLVDTPAPEASEWWWRRFVAWLRKLAGRS